MHSGTVRPAELYLASASPRRFELLTQIGLSPLILPQNLDETLRSGEAPELYVHRLAREKAIAGLRDPEYRRPLPLLAADTAVVCNGQVLGKPGSEDEARSMLRSLSGSVHQVMTAVAVAGFERIEQALVVSEVSFRVLDDEEITLYWQSGEPRDKAGAYAIQGLGAMFVSHIKGSYSGVVGLPLFETLQLLARFGMDSRTIMKGRVNEH